jgi:hypothetical protein
VTEEVTEAIEEVQATFPDQRIEVRPSPDGGTVVIVHGLDPGPAFTGPTWLGFTIPFNYPGADVYPHFIRPDLGRRDGRPVLAEGMQATTWEGQPVIQLSRRSNRWRPATDTAAKKALKVLQWLQNRP